ncbi:MAG: DUF3089 domain-containing protein, partial [Clostridia bacterium]|nr:DUF3089 domain-containing protein [Clostridia bacterium]
MKKMRYLTAMIIAFAVAASVTVFVSASADGVPDYSDVSSWAYFGLGEDRGVDVFLICPTVDTKSETNSFDLNEKLKQKFVNALDMEKGIYEDAGRLFSPYYRQMSMNAYRLSEGERERACAIAYADVSAAFRWYLDNESGGRGLILAGFSQGSQMCLELLKEYFGGDGEEASSLRERLITVYCIGWSVTEEMTEEYPQIIPAAGEADVGTVVSFDCENGTLSDTIVIPEGTKALSINPLNWKTDGTKADKSLNRGAVMSTGAEPIPALCGAYLGARGELVATGVTIEEYPTVLDIFPDGSYHIYDYMFYFENLKDNIAVRVNAWRTGLPFKDVGPEEKYLSAVRFAYEEGLMVGMGGAVFSPDTELTRAQLVTVIWRYAGKPRSNGDIMPFNDVKASAWYLGAVFWASGKLIAYRSGGLFGPNEKLTLAEAAQIIWEYAKAEDADVSVGEETNILSYEDAFEIPQEYVPAMKWAV